MAGPDYSGQTFGTVAVVRVSRSTAKKKYWLCVCKCGAEIELRAEHFIGPRAGCRKCTKAMLRHGHWTGGKATRTHQAWRSMKKRCSLKKNAAFKSHGGRGITVCDRWKDSFENFLADMGECSEGKSLDRYPDNDGNYEPGNCRWATAKEQGRNRRDNRLIEYQGASRPMSEWADIFGINSMTLKQRLDRGWSTHEALTSSVPTWRGS